jgi:hypothetical protein
MQNMTWQRGLGYALVFVGGGLGALWPFIGTPAWWQPVLAVLGIGIGILLPRPQEP